LRTCLRFSEPNVGRGVAVKVLENGRLIGRDPVNIVVRLSDLPSPGGHHGACHRGAMFRTRPSVFLPLPATTPACPGGAMFPRHAVGGGTRHGVWRTAATTLEHRTTQASCVVARPRFGGDACWCQTSLDGGKLRRGGDTSAGQILRFPSSSAGVYPRSHSRNRIRGRAEDGPRCVRKAPRQSESGPCRPGRVPVAVRAG